VTDEPKVVDAEVVQELPPALHRGSSQTDFGPPIHPLSALLLLVVDNLWNLAEWVVVDWVITIPLSFFTVFVPSLVIQKVLKRQRFGVALGYATLLAALAAIPTSILGTPVGAALLAWFGINKLWSGRRDRTMP
jgi:hypothetical protein